MHTIDHSRRTFLKASAAAGGGLLIGFCLPGVGRLAHAAAPPGEINAWIKIGRDNKVTATIGQAEMGQGPLTSLTMMLAEELEADWSQMQVEQAPNHAAYHNPRFNAQATGGSSSIRSVGDPVRKAGAAARQMLIAAAAQSWKVSEADCYAQKGFVIHKPSGRRLRYGQLAERAAQLPVPQQVTLKKPGEFKIIGKSLPRLDTPQKVNGQARFGIDVKVPGMLTAVVARSPVFGGKVASFNADKAKAIKGVRHVVAIGSGVAVVAEHFWAAKKGREALEVSWDEGALAGLSSESLRTTYQQLAQKPGAVARNDGDADAALKGAAKKIEAVYEAPFLAHATMEPMNCTAHVRADACEIWVPTQAQTAAQNTAAKITGLPPEAITVHTTFLGGGFGRRFEQDYTAEAVELSKAVGAPVKVVWTREDDMQHDFYRPATYNTFQGGLDAQGRPVAWTHRIVGPSIMSRAFPARIKEGLDPSSVQGAADVFPYSIPNVRVDYVMQHSIPVGFWRSVGDSQNGFVTQGFIDELAVASGQDPYEFRRQWLNSLRHKAVLELAAAKAGWGRPLPAGVHRGIAVHFAYGGYVAEVAEVSVGKEGRVKVHRVVCAIDTGWVVNPDTVKAQMESCIVYGLTAALYGEITLKNGRVVQSNFHDYPMLRINEMPRIEVHIVESREPPGGAGEPGTPPIAPAVVNAVYAATGKRIRRLPIRPDDLRA